METIIRTTGAKPKECKDPDRAFGRETRSLKAIYELFQVQFFSEEVCFTIDLFFGFRMTLKISSMQREVLDNGRMTEWKWNQRNSVKATFY